MRNQSDLSFRVSMVLAAACWGFATVMSKGALAEGFVSVTPLQLDLTAYRALTDLNTWHWEEPLLDVPLVEALQQELLISQ